MQAMDRLAEALGGELAHLLRAEDTLCEIRLRVGKPAVLVRLDGSRQYAGTIPAENFHRMLARLMGDSMYACEEELKQGYFTMEGGIRVGVCGRMNAQNGCVSSLANIGSACIRIPREIHSEEARRLWKNPPENMLIISPPGMGKTTLVRSIAKVASDSGVNVAIADERREIAACREGIAQFDVGVNTDVMDGCPKALAIQMMLRACAPELIVADEIGGQADMDALIDAARCGAKVIATAHAANFADAELRFGRLFRQGVMRRAVLMGPEPGKIRAVREYENQGEMQC